MGVLILPSFDHPRHLKSRVPALPAGGMGGGGGTRQIMMISRLSF